MWDARSGSEIAVLNAHEAGVLSAAFSPDGERIVTASSDETARVWDARSGSEIAVLNAHEGAVASAWFSPDGGRIVTASDDNMARVWDVSRTEAIVGDPAIVLAAALAHGIGYRTAFEASDLLMQDAPDDLFEEALRQLGRSADDAAVQKVAAALRAPLDPRCYLSPTQRAEASGTAATDAPPEDG